MFEIVIYIYIQTNNLATRVRKWVFFNILTQLEIGTLLSAIFYFFSV